MGGILGAALAWANPALLWGGLLVLVPVAVHLLSKRRVQRRPFAALGLLLGVRRQEVRHVRLRDLLLMLLRVALVLALAVAVARPLLRPQGAVTAGPSVAATVLVLDASLSMQWSDGEASLLERARQEGQRLLEGLPVQSPSGVVVCDGGTPQVEAPSFDRAAAGRLLREARGSWRKVDLAPCLAAAGRALGESVVPAKRIYVLTDLTETALGEGLSAPQVPTPQGDVTPEVVFVDVAAGRALANLAVVELQVTPSAALGARGYEVAAVVQNGGTTEARGVPLVLRVAGRVVSRSYVDVASGERVRKVLSHRFEPGLQQVEVALESDGAGAAGLRADDGRTFLLPVPRDVRALIVNGAPSAVRYLDEAFFVETALGPERTGGRVTTRFVDPEALATQSLDEVDVVVLLNLPPPAVEWAASLRAFVERGGGLLVAAGDQMDPDGWNGTGAALLPRPLHLLRTAVEPPPADGSGDGLTDVAGAARVAGVRQDHPALRALEGGSEALSSARFYRYLLPQTDAASDAVALVTLDDGTPLLTEAQRGRGRVVFYGSTVDRDWTDWPLRPSFLPLLQQLVTYLAGGLDERPTEPVKIGEIRPVPMAEGARLVEVRGPDGRPVRLVEGGVPVEQPGLYRVWVEDAQGSHEVPAMAFAAVTDARESDLKRVSPDWIENRMGGEGAARVAGGADDAAPRNGTPVWPWLLLTVVAVFVAEGLWLRRA